MLCRSCGEPKQQGLPVGDISSPSSPCLQMKWCGNSIFCLARLKLKASYARFYEGKQRTWTTPLKRGPNAGFSPLAPILHALLTKAMLCLLWAKQLTQFRGGVLYECYNNSGSSKDVSNFRS